MKGNPQGLGCFSLKVLLEAQSSSAWTNMWSQDSDEAGGLPGPPCSISNNISSDKITAFGSSAQKAQPSPEIPKSMVPRQRIASHPPDKESDDLPGGYLVQHIF